MDWITGGITAPRGFTAATAAAGLRRGGGDDIALVASDRPCAAAGIFTTNLVKAAPVLLDQQTLAANPAAIRAVVANAGNANACTGPAGMDAARGRQDAAATGESAASPTASGAGSSAAARRP